MATALQARTEIIQLPNATRAATLTLTSAKGEEQSPVDLEARTAVFSFSSEQPVERFDWADWKVFDEILSHDPEHVNLKRVGLKACPLLWNHDRCDQRGIVEEAWIEGDRRAYCKVRFSKSAEGERLMQDVADRIVTSVSFMYQVYEMDLTKKAEPKNTYTATNWEVLEVSFVSIPADATVGISRDAEASRHNVTVKALPEELKKGDWVSWHSSGGTAKGRIETVATSGTVQAVPKGPSMEGSPDAPAYLVVVWSEEADGWMATDVKVVKRAAALTEIASLKKSAARSQESGVRSQQRKPKETKAVGKRKQAKTEVQTRELTLADYLSADSPTWDDITTAFADTLAAIDDAASSDSTLDTTMLYGEAIDDMTDQLYTLYDVPDPDAAEDTAETPMMTGEKTVSESPQETERDREYKALQQKVQLMERRELVTRKFTTLRQKAEALKSAGKLTPAEFKDKFGDLDAAIERYVKADDGAIASLEERLTDIEKYAVPVELGSRLKNEPLDVPETRSEYDAELEAYQKSRGK